MSKNKATITFVSNHVDHFFRSSAGSADLRVVRESFGETVFIGEVGMPIKDIFENDIGFIESVKADTMSGRIQILASIKNTPENRKALNLSDEIGRAIERVQKQVVVKHARATAKPKGKLRFG